MVKKHLSYVPRWLKNRYAISALALLGWVAFFDTHDLWSTYKIRLELGRMQDQHSWYEQEIERTREQLRQLTSDKELLEKFARERYLMKRENEEIFVLVPEQR